MTSASAAFLPPPGLGRVAHPGHAPAVRPLRASATSPSTAPAPPLAGRKAAAAAASAVHSSRRSLLQAALSATVASVVAGAGVGGLAIPPPAVAAATGTRVADPASTERTTASGVRLVDFSLGDGPLVGPGDTVSIDYTTGSTAARYGWKIDSTEAGWAGGPGRPPLVFVVGAGQVIPGLDEAVVTRRGARDGDGGGGHGSGPAVRRRREGGGVGLLGPSQPRLGVLRIDRGGRVWRRAAGGVPAVQGGCRRSESPPRPPKPQLPSSPWSGRALAAAAAEAAVAERENGEERTCLSHGGGHRATTLQRLKHLNPA